MSFLSFCHVRCRRSNPFLVTWCVVAFAIWGGHRPALAVDPTLVIRPIVNYSGNWHYLAPQSVGEDPGTATNQNFLSEWSSRDYDVNVPLTLSGGGVLSWQGPSPAPFSYGGVAGLEGIPGTTLPTPADGSRHSAYFRTEFEIDQQFTGDLGFHLLVDDGAIVRIDGVEMFRINCCLPEENDPALFTDRAEFGGIEEGVWVVHFAVPEELTLDVGTHALTVEVHQVDPASSDLGMIMRMVEDGPANIWDVDESGLWDDRGNWVAFGRPDSNTKIAVFGDVITEDRTIVLDESLSLRGLEFDNENSYLLMGTGTITLDSQVGDSTVDVLDGQHELQLELALNNDTQMQLATGTQLVLNNDLLLQGNTLTVSGNGEAQFNNAVVTDGGQLILVAASASGNGSIDGSVRHEAGQLNPGSGVGTLEVDGDYVQSEDAALVIDVLNDTETAHDILMVSGLAQLSGTLQVNATDAGQFKVGDVFQILEAGRIAGAFDRIDLPQLNTGQRWDLSGLYSAGALSVVPEPASWTLGAWLVLALAGRRRHWGLRAHIASSRVG